MSEAVVWRYFVKKVFLGISQNSQENTCARSLACIIIKKEALAQGFSCEFCEIYKDTFFTEHLRWLLLKWFSHLQFLLEVDLGNSNN